jgi:hypothetical protein
MTSIQTIQATDQITDSRADLNTNFANLNSDKIETSYLDDDTTLSANSDTKIATQKAVKAYIDAGGAPDFPPAFVTSSAGATDEGKGAKLGTAGIFNSTIVPQVGWFGNGQDGNVTISSGTTTLTKDMYYNNLIVNGTGILITAGYRVFVKGTLTVDKTSGAMIHNAGGNGGGGTAGSTPSINGGGGSAGSAGLAGYFLGGKAGQIGANGATTTPLNGVTGTASGALALVTTVGSAGGAGGNSSGGTGGGTGGVGGAITSSATSLAYSWFNAYFLTEITGASTLTFTKQNINAGAGSGGGGIETSFNGGAGGGGGSGGSGGVVWISARTLNLTGIGCINANGGNGGNGGNGTTGVNFEGGAGGGGAGGNGGVVIVFYYERIGTGTITANGGALGTGGTNSGTVGANASNGVTGSNGLVITFNS